MNIMDAIVIKSFGNSNVFEKIKVPKPLVKKGYVVVEVKATSVNPVDYKIRNGTRKELAPDFPAILHGDFSGIISKIGHGITDFNIGDEVYGCAGGLKDLNGALAQFMLADATLIAKKPTSLSFTEAAALPLVALTAWEGLFDKANIKPNQTILVHGGTGGVGHIAIQLAKWAGAKVYTTVSNQQKADIAIKLGALEAINYKEENINSYVSRLTKGHGFDIVFDTIGGPNLEKSFNAASYYGQVIAIQSGGQSSYSLTIMQLKSLSLHFIYMLIPMLHNIKRKNHGHILKQLADIIDQGHIYPLIDPTIFNFDQVGEAHNLLESRKAIGKVVLIR